MYFGLFLMLFSATAFPAVADTVVPVRTIRAQEVIAAADLTIHPSANPGAIRNAADIIGMEARVALYAGRPVRPGDVGPPALVNRNDVIALIFHQGGLRIVTEGRAMGRGAAGDRLRVMNLASRTSVWGLVRLDGSVEVE